MSEETEFTVGAFGEQEERCLSSLSQAHCDPCNIQEVSRHIMLGPFSCSSLSPRKRLTDPHNPLPTLQRCQVGSQTPRTALALLPRL